MARHNNCVKKYLFNHSFQTTVISIQTTVKLYNIQIAVLTRSLQQDLEGIVSTSTLLCIAYSLYIAHLSQSPTTKLAMAASRQRSSLMT